MYGFAFGTDESDHVSVEVHGHPDDADDWLDATIRVSAGAFGGQYSATLERIDFPRFRSEVEALYRSLDSVARFDTIEGQLELTCKGNGRGGIAIHGVAQDLPGDGNELTFRLETDQTFLPAIITQLRKIESQYPNRLPPAIPESE